MFGLISVVHYREQVVCPYSNNSCLRTIWLQSENLLPYIDFERSLFKNRIHAYIIEIVGQRCGTELCIFGLDLLMAYMGTLVTLFERGLSKGNLN